MKALKFSIVFIFALSALTQAGAQHNPPSSASEPSDAQSAKEIDPQIQSINESFGVRLLANGNPFGESVEKIKQRLNLSNKTKKIANSKKPDADYSEVAENPNLKIFGLQPMQIKFYVHPPYLDSVEILFYDTDKVRIKKPKKTEIMLLNDIFETLVGGMKKTFGAPSETSSDERAYGNKNMFSRAGASWYFENCVFSIHYQVGYRVSLSVNWRLHRGLRNNKTPAEISVVQKASSKNRNYDDVIIKNFPKAKGVWAAVSKLSSPHLIDFVMDLSDIFELLGKPEFSAEKIAEICLENPDAEYKSIMDNIKRAAAENKVVVKEFKPDMASIKRAIDAGIPVNCCVKTRSMGALANAGHRSDLQRNNSNQQEYIKFLKSQKNFIEPAFGHFVYNEFLILGYNKATDEVYTRKYRWIRLQDLKTILASPLYTYSVKK